MTTDVIDRSRTAYMAPPVIDRLQSTALVVGVIGLLVCAAAAFLYPASFFRAYLVGFMFWTGVSVGSLVILMIHHLSGGGWGVVIRRILEASTRTLVVPAVLFIPIIVALFTHHLYPWTNPAEVAGNEALIHKQFYLSIPFFVARAALYFLIWGGLAYFLNKWSLQQDDAPNDARLAIKMRNVSGPGILIFGLAVTFAGIDWVMSLEPEWFSTIYGLLVLAGWGLSALAFTIWVETLLVARAPMDEVYTKRHFHDHGKLLLAFIMLWTYFSFSQFLIIWSANLPEEIPFYLRRLRLGWQFVALALVLFHFVLPFALLLSRDLKRHARRLGVVALLVLVMRVVDLFWLIGPSAVLVVPRPEESGQAGGGGDVVMYVLCFVTPIALGGIWLWYFARQLKQRPLLPLGDEGLANALAHGEGHH